jgi:cytochrome c
MRTGMWKWVALAALAGLAVSPVRAQDTALGLELVTTYCADCHAVGASGDSPLAPAPPLRDLHQRYDVEWLNEALVEGLATGHPEMPEFEFDPDQAAAIIAYLKSLEPEALH